MVHRSEERFKKLDFEIFETYHSNFKGDTYDICQDCGGECEKYAISTLLPGEKEYISKKLNMEIEKLENKYLDKINTPFGNVEVIKLKKNCPWLNEDYNCTIKDVKPILCDSYPIIFRLENDHLNYEIDNGCPCSHNQKYKDMIKNFKEKGIIALKKIEAPLEWWKTVEYYDGFDYDYINLEKRLRKTDDYQEFYLEEILGFACLNGEVSARETGITLLEIRIKNLNERLNSKLELENKKLTEEDRETVNNKMLEINSLLNESKENKRVFDKNNPDEYLFYVKKIILLISQIEKFINI